MSAQLSKKTSILLLLIFVLLVPTASLPGQVTVLPRGSVVAGRTIPEWTVEWWKWSMALPATGHPWFDETGADALRGQSGPVIFLIGVVNESGMATRSISIPEETYLLFPIINVLNNATGENPWGTITEQLLDGGIDFASLTTELHGSLDGGPLTNLLFTTGQPITNLFALREVSPEFSVRLAPSNNVFQFFGFELTGILDPCFSDGYWVMLAPLPPGQHMLNFGGSFGRPFSFALDINYRIYVEPLSLPAAVQSLNKLVRQAPLAPGRLQSFSSNLEVASTSFESGRLRAGINQLRAFQNQVRAQLAANNPVLAEQLVREAQRIIDAATRRVP